MMGGGRGSLTTGGADDDDGDGDGDGDDDGDDNGDIKQKREFDNRWR